MKLTVILVALLVRLDELKTAGILRGYQILFNSFTTTMTWDAMAGLHRADYAKTRASPIRHSSPSIAPCGFFRKCTAI